MLFGFQVALVFEVGSVVVHEAVDDKSTAVTGVIDSCYECQSDPNNVASYSPDINV